MGKQGTGCSKQPLFSLDEMRGALHELLRIKCEHRRAANPLRPGYVPDSVIEAMFSNVPELLVYKTRYGEHSVLEEVFRFGSYPRLTGSAKSIKIESFEIEATGFSLQNGFLPCVLDNGRASWLRQLIPQLKKFVCNPPCWTEEGFLKLVPALSESGVLGNLTLDLPVDLFQANPALLESLKKLVTNKPVSLQQLVLNANSNDGDAELLFMKTLADALRLVKRQPPSVGVYRSSDWRY